MSPDLPALVAQGLSDAAIAAELGVSARTVLRWRQRAGIASQWVAPQPVHGTLSRYQNGCRCAPCVQANRDSTAHYRHTYQSRARQAVNAHEPWTPDDDVYLLTGPGRLVDRARVLGRTYHAAALRSTVLRRRERLTA